MLRDFGMLEIHSTGFFLNQKILEALPAKERLSSHKDIENNSEGEDRICALIGCLG